MKILEKTPCLGIIVFGLIIALCLGFVYATPQIPTVFHGDVTYTGNPSMNLYGYDINFTVGSDGPVKVGTVGSGNSFEVDVDPNENIGQDIHFFIGGSEANEVGSYVKGGFVELDLTIDNPPTQVIDPEEYCGDGTCNNGETCSTCSQDCGECDGDGDGDNGDDNDGGSSGSSSSSSSSNDVIVLGSGSSDSGSSNSGSQPRTPITGGVVDGTAQDNYNFGEFLSSGGLIMILSGMIIVLGIILLLLPKK